MAETPVGAGTPSWRRAAPKGLSPDLSTVAGAKTVVREANKLGPFDAIIHNAGIGSRLPHRVETEPGVPNIFAVNVLAPYILTALIESPERLIYSSGMHQGVRPQMDDLPWTKRAWSGSSAYAESELCDVVLAFAVARRWRNIFSNAMEPGWVPTKMGGPSAPDDPMEGCVTQAWLATSEDAPARSTGGSFYHQRPRSVNPLANDVFVQEQLLAECRRISGITLD